MKGINLTQITIMSIFAIPFFAAASQESDISIEMTIQAAFNYLDQDQNNCISESEWGVIPNEFDNKDDLFKKTDLDKNGCITMIEIEEASDSI